MFEQTFFQLGQFSGIIYSNKTWIGILNVRYCPEEISMAYTIIIYSITGQIITIYHLCRM